MHCIWLAPQDKGSEGRTQARFQGHLCTEEAELALHVIILRLDGAQGPSAFQQEDVCTHSFKRLAASCPSAFVTGARGCLPTASQAGALQLASARCLLTWQPTREDRGIWAAEGSQGSLPGTPQTFCRAQLPVWAVF